MYTFPYQYNSSYFAFLHSRYHGHLLEPSVHNFLGGYVYLEDVVLAAIRLAGVGDLQHPAIFRRYIGVLPLKDRSASPGSTVRSITTFAFRMAQSNSTISRTVIPTTGLKASPTLPLPVLTYQDFDTIQPAHTIKGWHRRPLVSFHFCEECI